eukprot:275229_1
MQIILILSLQLISYTNCIPNDFYDISCSHQSDNETFIEFTNKSFLVEKTLDEDYHVLYDTSTGRRSNLMYNYMLQIQDSSHNTNSSHHPNSNHHTAYMDFAFCLEANHDELRVKDLKDLYRIRGIPKHCCSSLASAVLPTELMEMFQEDHGSDCRINSFFVPNGGFDPHSHPLFFASIIVTGAYSHSYFEKEILDDVVCLPCNPIFHQICTQHNKIYRKNDNLPLEYHGTVKLHKIYQESFTTGDFIGYNGDDSIHIIDEYFTDTVTVNWMNAIGDNEIDVFTDHQSPFRTVLTKSDTRNGIKGALRSVIIDKSIGFFK